MNIQVEIRELQIRRGKNLVLDVPHLGIPRGQVLAVIGPNGAGKSTLLLAVNGLLKASSGDILYNGVPFSQKNGLMLRRRMALVLQEPLLLDVSVFENVALGLQFRRLPRVEIRKQVDIWLARLGIEHLRERRGSALSGGEAQRVSLARALAIQPELLLLDEPFSALDSPTRTKLLSDLKSLLDETGTTTIFVTHDLDEAHQLGQRVAIILNGNLRQSGSLPALRAHPADDDVAAFLGERQ